MPSRPYHDFRTYLGQRYGARVYRVPVDLGLGCPHRDPVTLAGGCSFCGSTGARAVHLRPRLPLVEQVRLGVRFGAERYGATRFLAYFQAFTSTYAPVARLRELYGEVLGAAEFCGVIVSTRPDCLSPDVVAYLAELRQTRDVWVELGVQSANDQTLAWLNRGHGFAASQASARALAAHGIAVAAHLILGLPGETEADFDRTAAALRQEPFSGVKIHNLHVVADTPLAEAWRRGEVQLWDEHEYAEVLMRFLRLVPATWPVMRLTSDTPRASLLAPRWHLDKGQFLALIAREMRRRGWHQGDLV